MEGFLLGLSPQRTNPTDLAIKYIQLILPTSTITEAVDVAYTLG